MPDLDDDDYEIILEALSELRERMRTWEQTEQVTRKSGRISILMGKIDTPQGIAAFPLPAKDRSCRRWYGEFGIHTPLC